jgi:hypothetical protein
VACSGGVLAILFPAAHCALGFRPSLTPRLDIYVYLGPPLRVRGEHACAPLDDLAMILVALWFRIAREQARQGMIRFDNVINLAGVSG